MIAFSFKDVNAPLVYGWEMSMRCLKATLLLVLVSFFTGCSYPTEFVVVNATGHPVEVRYRSTKRSGNQVPAKKAASELNDDEKWRELTPDQYQVDTSGLTSVTKTRLMDSEALRVVVIADYDFYDESRQAEFYPFDEIVIVSSDGELRLTGQQARTAFVKVSRNLYTLTYK